MLFGDVVAFLKATKAIIGTLIKPQAVAACYWEKIQ
jgi:hypothetical protein